MPEHKVERILSVVIATYNRAELVDEAVSSLSRQRGQAAGGPVEDAFEVIVVDNASTDDTGAVVGKWRQRMGNLRYIHEARQGVGYARNRGIEEACGRFVVFLDDECTVAEDFVATLVARVAGREPILFGGPIYPRYPSTPPKPRWFQDAYGSFSVFGDDAGAGDFWLSGANMGGRRDALLAIGGFSLDLGPRGQRMVYGEEQELVDRVRARYGAGAVHYFRNIPVWHLVRPEKYHLPNIFAEECRRGYWRGRLSDRDPGEGRRTINVDRKDLVVALLRTPFLRDRTRYPFLQNYMIEVVLPFFRLGFVLLGWTAQTVARRLTSDGKSA